MILSVYLAAFGGSPQEGLAAAAECGYEGIEVRGKLAGVPLGEVTPAAYEAFVETATEHGLAVVTLALGAIGSMVEDPDGLRSVGRLAAMSGSRVRLFSSPRRQRLTAGEAYPEPDSHELEREAMALRRCVEALRAGGQEVGAEPLIMIEAEPDSIANTVARQVTLIERADTGWIGINWDFVNHWMAGEYPWPAPWKLLRPLLAGIHYKGAMAEPRRPWQYAGQALPDHDDLPHRGIWSALATEGFAGPVTVDPHHTLFRRPLVDGPADGNAEVCRRTLPILQEYRAAAVAAHD